jgi:hypothetical protein
LDALLDFSSCLRSQGVLVIQNRNFDAVLRHRERWMEPQTHQEGNQQWVFQRFYDFNSDGTLQFNIVSLHRHEGGEWKAQIHSTRLWPQTGLQLSEALSKSGFDQIQFFGSLQGGEFDPLTSGNLVIFAKKAS